jgi:hypothetical protein
VLFYMCFQFSHVDPSKAISAPVIITTAMFIAVFTESVLFYIESQM